jgi:hypothetical protein
MYTTEIRQMTELTSMQIQALVRNMDSSLRKYKVLKRDDPATFRQKVVEENQTLYDMFPSVFEMHFEGKLDATFFEMLKLKRKIEQGELTEDEASKIIGQKLFDRFVSPVVNKLPPVEGTMSYSDYYKQFK